MVRRARRGGLLLPLILIAAGVLFLLGNLDVVSFESWHTLLRFWPVLLIAAGIDLIVGRSSIGGALSTLVTICILLVVGFVAFQLFAPGTWRFTDHGVRVSLDDTTEARVSLTCDECALRIDGTSSHDALIEGSVSTPRFATLTQRASRSEGMITFELTSTPKFWLPLSAARSADATWHLSLNRTTPIELTVSSAGPVDLDLRNVRIRTLDLTAGEDPSRITLSASSDARYYVEGDDITLVVPSRVDVCIELGGPPRLILPVGYVQTGSRILSQDWGTAEVRAIVISRPNTGRLSVENLAQED